MYEKLAVIGDADLLYAFRALGIDVFSPQSAAEARMIMEDLQGKNYAVCFFQEDFLDGLDRTAWESRSLPVVVGFSRLGQVAGHREKLLSTIVTRSAGSDAPLKGQHGHGKR